MSKNFWSITETERIKKCASHLIIDKKLQSQQNVANLFFLIDCEETHLFRDVICEKTPPRQVCSSHKQCHPRAECIQDRCLCNAGFDGDGYMCFDVNECKTIGLHSITTCRASYGRMVGPYLRPHHEADPNGEETRSDTRLPKSRAGGQGPYLRSLDHLGISSEVQK